MTDIARLDQLRRHLRTYPDLHGQHTFACNTTACAAGWTVALEQGIRMDTAYDTYGGVYYQQTVETVVLSAATRRVAHAVSKDWKCTKLDGPPHDIATYARMLLDLTEDEAIALFYRTGDANALLLIDALINREKGELTEEDIEILEYFELSTKPSGDAVQ